MYDNTKRRTSVNVSLDLGSVLNHSRDLYVYHEGILYRRGQGTEVTLLNYALPVIDWYDLVTIAVNPENDDELWIAFGPHGLYHSQDGGKTFQILPSVAMAEKIVSAEIQCIDVAKYALVLKGRLSCEWKGKFFSIDGGKNWIELSDSAERQRPIEEPTGPKLPIWDDSLEIH